MSLWDLNEQESGAIDSIKDHLSKETIIRLREMGISKGGKVVCLKTIPFGGPKLFQISDSVFSLEKPVAEAIVLTQ